jgi:hypothetical protein
MSGRLSNSLPVTGFTRTPSLTAHSFMAARAGSDMQALLKTRHWQAKEEKTDLKWADIPEGKF